MSEIAEIPGQKPGKKIALGDARHFERDGFSGDVYVEPDSGHGFSALHVDVHGRHPLKRMVDATRSYLVLEGSGTFTLNGEKSEVKKGDLFVVPHDGEYEYQGNMELFELNVPGTTSENSITLEPTVEGPQNEVLPLNDVAVIDVNPALSVPQTARALFDVYLKNNPKAIVLSAYGTGTLPSSFTPLIQECTDKGISVFILSGNYGDEHGIQKVNYEAQVGPEKAGAIPLRDVNVKHLVDVTQMIQSAVNTGLTGDTLNQAVIDKFGTPVEPSAQ